METHLAYQYSQPTPAPLSATAWYRGATSEQWRAFASAYLGWALDIMDLMLFAMVISQVGKDIGFGRDAAGLVASITLVATAGGGLIFGYLADRIGRAKSMMLSIVCYSVGAALCGLADSFAELLIFRVILGLGVGGEWSTGAALIAETWPPEHRGKVMAWVQSAFPVGYALAALIAALVLPHFGWRWVFAVGLLPAVLAILLRRQMHEPQIWLERKERRGLGATFSLLFNEHRRPTLVALGFTSAAMCGYWGLFTWIPTYLSSATKEGGLGMDLFRSTTWIVCMQVGAGIGCVAFGYLADRFGRRISFASFFLLAAALIPAYASVTSPTTALIVGVFVAFFSNGFFSGFGPTLAELFPTPIRATAQGFIYNTGRAVSAAAPALVGFAAAHYGMQASLILTAGFFLVAAVIVIGWLPETLNKRLD